MNTNLLQGYQAERDYYKACSAVVSALKANIELKLGLEEIQPWVDKAEAAWDLWSELVKKLKHDEAVARRL